MFEANDYMSSSEKLVAFLDGELPQEDTTTLFYELAQNADLQDEMRQFVHLRNNLRNTQVVPQPHLKNNIMKNIGLKEGPLTTFFDASSKTAALLIALFYNRTSLSIIVVAMLSVGAILLLNNATDKYETAKAPLQSQNLSVAVNSGIPVSESLIADDMNEQVESQSSQDNDYVKSGAVSNVKGKSNRRAIYSQTSNTGKIADINTLTNDIVKTNTNSDGVNNLVLPTVFPSGINNFNIPFGINSQSPNRRRMVADNDLLAGIMQNTTLYINRMGARSYPDFSLPGENNPLFNDLRIGIRYKFADNHSIGLAGGMENFLMTFDKEEADGIIYQYDQSWNGWWIGLTYHYNFGELMNTGLYPELNVLAGSTPVGPLFRGGLGMNYFITEDFYLNFGFEAGTMIFNQNQSSGNSKWFSTEKLGYTIGVGVGL